MDVEQTLIYFSDRLAELRAKRDFGMVPASAVKKCRKQIDEILKKNNLTSADFVRITNTTYDG